MKKDNEFKRLEKSCTGPPDLIKTLQSLLNFPKWNPSFPRWNRCVGSWMQTLLPVGSALKVYLRLRPCVGSTPFTKPAFEPHSETTVASTTATLEHQQQKCFNFTKVFPEGSSQEQLFQGVVKELLDAFIEGKNVLLFAYGPTAGGKTHTMQGPCTDPGIVPRTLDRLFHLLGTQICQGAPVRPDCFDEVVQLNTTEEAAVLQLKNQLLGEKGARSAADFSTFHLPRNGSDASLFLSRSSTGSHDSAGQ
ncbi:hypothetical protein V5799_010154, partial [Amblyomma americanum]